MSEAEMTVAARMHEPEQGMEAGEEVDLEEGECSEDEAEAVPQPPAPQDKENANSEVASDKTKHKEEKKEKKHKRRSRSDSRERHRSRKHKKKKGKDKEKEKDGEEEEEEEDEATKKRAMLRRLKALEGEMGLVESEDEDSSGSFPGTGGDLGKKRKREKGEKERVKKKWKGPETRFCNLYLQGKCPRDESECMFSHAVEVPKVWELCKFYVYDRCVKKDKCLYLHKGFPCKFFHLGLECPNDNETCKFSHETLSDTTRNLLLKHVETAPKELLGDFPRLTRHEATTAVWNTEAKNNGWTLPHDQGRGSRWDRPVDQPAHHVMEGLNPYMLQNKSGFNSPQPWAGGMGILGSPPKASGKPTGLMDVKINEQLVQNFLSKQRKESEGEGREDDQVDPWSRDGGGDETPEITPPVSPAGNLEINEFPSMPKTQQKLFQRIQQKQKDSGSPETPEVHHNSSKDDYYSDEEGDSDVLESVLKNLNSGLNSPGTKPPQLAGMGQPTVGITPLGDRASNLPSTPDSSSSKKGEKKDPRLHKVDPRKERQARREEEDRLEREKDQRILELDLGSVFGDLELPPLTLSPRQTDEEKYLSEKLNLPFKPHIYQVAKEIDASVHSHPPIDWLLIPVDVPERDYSNLKHHFSTSQIEMDPRLRRPVKTGIAKMKDLPLPNLPAPKSDPRLKGRTDPRRPAVPVQPPTAESRRRSSEDSEGNRVYNPARELSKAKPTGSMQGEGPGLSPTQGMHGESFSPGHRNLVGNHEFYQEEEMYNNQHHEEYYPDDYRPDEFASDQYEQDPMGYMDPMEQQDPSLHFPPSQELTFQQMQISMGILKGIQENMEAMLKHEGMDSRLMNDFSRGRAGFNQHRGFPSGGPNIRGFTHNPPRGQWVPRFGRGDFRGRPDFGRGSRGNSMVHHRPRDPRVK